MQYPLKLSERMSTSDNSALCTFFPTGSLARISIPDWLYIITAKPSAP